MIRRLFAGAAIACALMVGACISSTTPDMTPAQRAYAAKADYLALLQVAVAYESQPRCTAGQTIVDSCSSPAVVAELRKADADAFAALNAAESAVRSPLASSTVGGAVAAAEAAVSALRQILTNRGVLRR